MDFSSFTHVRSIHLLPGAFSDVTMVTMNGLNELVSMTIGTSALISTQTLVIGDSSLNALTALQVEGLVYLTTLTVGVNSLTSITSFTTPLSLVSSTWPVTITNCARLSTLPTQLVSNLTIAPQVCTESSFTTLLFDHYEVLKELVIEDHACTQVTSLEMNTLNNLIDLHIAASSLTAVRSIHIGSTSLQSLSEFDFTHFPELRTLSIGANALTKVPSVVFAEPCLLTSVVIGDNACTEASMLELGTAPMALEILQVGKNCFAGAAAVNLNSM